LRDALVARDPDGKHGGAATKALSVAELDALIAYLLQLDGLPPQPPPPAGPDAGADAEPTPADSSGDVPDGGCHCRLTAPSTQPDEIPWLVAVALGMVRVARGRRPRRAS
jgi:hypothetical protein